MSRAPPRRTAGGARGSHLTARVGRYQVTRRLGRGQWGPVLEAFDPHLERSVALQIVSTRRSITDEVHGRFWREARNWARVAHPNVVSVHDIGQAGTLLYVAYELVSGVLLDRLIRERRPAELAERLALTLQICDALQAAHDRGVLHGRLHPAAIVLTEDGRIKIGEFGMVSRGPETCDGTVEPGLVPYLAPEQVWGRLDPRSNVFSAGAICYELLTFTPAVGGHDAVTRLRELTSPTPITVPAGAMLPPDVAAVVERAVRKDPAARFADVAEFRVALESLLVRHALATLTREAEPPASSTSCRSADSQSLWPDGRSGIADSGSPTSWRPPGFWSCWGGLPSTGRDGGRREPAAGGVRKGARVAATAVAPSRSERVSWGRRRRRLGLIRRRRSRGRLRRVVDVAPGSPPRLTARPPTPPSTSPAADAPPAPVAPAEPALPEAAGSHVAGAVSEAPVAPPSMTISGDTARVAWQVTDLRAANPEPTRRRWTYTVVLTEHAGVTVWLQEQESGLILPAGTRTVDRTVLSARLDSTHEMRLAMSAELDGLAPASLEPASSRRCGYGTACAASTRTGIPSGSTSGFRWWPASAPHARRVVCDGREVPAPAHLTGRAASPGCLLSCLTHEPDRLAPRRPRPGRPGRSGKPPRGSAGSIRTSSALPARCCGRCAGPRQPPGCWPPRGLHRARGGRGVRRRGGGRGGRGGLGDGALGFAYRTFRPIVLLLFSVPKMVMLPLFILFFGIGVLSKAVFTLQPGGVPRALNVIAGSRMVDRTLVTDRLLHGRRVVPASSSRWCCRPPCRR